MVFQVKLLCNCKLFYFSLYFLTNITGKCGFERTNIKNGDVIDIKSPNYPYFYPPNFQCTWKVSAIKREGSFAIQFLIFDTQPETDIFTIEKGNSIRSEPVIFTLSSWMPPNVVAIIEEEELWITFKSDWAKSGRGFELRIERLPNTGRKKGFREGEKTRFSLKKNLTYLQLIMLLVFR